jgi:hypothetical protein
MGIEPPTKPLNQHYIMGDSLGMAATHKDRVLQLWDSYDSLIQDGAYISFGYPFGSLPFIMIVLLLLLPAKYASRTVRLVWSISAQALCLYFIFYTRARTAATSGLLGLGCMYFILWITANLIVVDAKTAYERIRRVEICGLIRPGAPKRKTLISYSWQPIPDALKERLDWILDLFSKFFFLS